MIIKDSNKEQYYEFKSESFSFLKLNELSKNTEGELFMIGFNKYVLYKNEKATIIQSKIFKIEIENYSFKYYESIFFSHLLIYNKKNKFNIKKIKSIWELITISTYDYLEKIEDNKLFFLFDRIKDFKTNEKGNSN